MDMRACDDGGNRHDLTGLSMLYQTILGNFLEFVMIT